MKSILRHPFFICGLLFRLICVILLRPVAATIWYAPFLDSSVNHFALDPWGSFLLNGGTPLAFPYGYVMWLGFLPLTALFYGLGLPAIFGYSLTLLCADFGCLLVLRRLFSTSDRLILFTYWLSPIVLFTTYWLGLNDLIPVLLLCLSLLAIRKQKAIVSGAFCAAAVSAKLSMVLAVPMLAIYLYRNRTLNYLLANFAKGFLVILAAFGVPFVFSKDAVHMLFSNPEVAKIYDLAVHYANGSTFYVLPMAYLLTAFIAWRIRRINFDLLVVLLGISFFLILLLTPAAPGWFLWILPLFVYYQATGGRKAIGVVTVFTVMYVVTDFLSSPRPVIAGDLSVDQWANSISRQLGEKGLGILNTMVLSLGIILIMRIWRETVRKNDYFRISRKPFLIGIAGDSGAGKDTLVDLLADLFGHHSVARLGGDDYHFWDRHKPMWQVMTHLNPRANDLDKFAQDLMSLRDGRTVHARHYDHSEGKKTKPLLIRANDFVIASGLHALYSGAMRDCYDLSIYLDIDDGLRRHFKLDRDVRVRGHEMARVLASMEKREEDSKKFIRPQSTQADLVLSLLPLDPESVKNFPATSRIRHKLAVKTKHGFREESLVRALVSLCCLDVDVRFNDDNSEITIVIEGDVSAEDLSFSARRLMPDIFEVLDVNPKWENGMSGLMQLVTLSHVHQKLRRRLV